MEIIDVLPRSQVLVKELAEGLNLGSCTFERVEQRILQFLYELGQAMEAEVLAGVELPRFGRQVRACGRGNAPVLLFIPNRAFIVQG